MRTDMNHRYAVVVDGNNNIEMDFKDIKKGMLFRLFEPNGKPVRANIDDAYMFEARKDVYENKDGILVVEITI